MLRAYGPDCDGSLIESAGTIPDGATWIDLEEPTREEEKIVEKCLGLDVPTQDELAEIEPLSRLYEKNGAIYMTMGTLYGVDDGEPASTPIGFVLTRNRLVTVRYATPKPLRTFAAHARTDPDVVRNAPTALIRLLDAIIERLADELEASGAEIERIYAQIFRRDSRASPSQRRIPAQRLEALLLRIGRAQGLLARIRETAVSAGRLIGFLAATDRMRADEGDRDRVHSLGADVSSLIDHSAFLAQNLTFLLDASLGLISVEQNAAIKVFSVAAVVFLPPTLVAGVYGMNFEHMPELKWLAGYPFALGAMLLSAILPYWWFKRRGWL
ncbi:MAG: magnesium transporter CorA family protein [Sphingomicrobium sp.]